VELLETVRIAEQEYLPNPKRLEIRKIIKVFWINW
jgi:hypothetical protein